MAVFNFKVGDIIKVEVIKIHDFGAIVKFPNDNRKGLIHISQISEEFVKDINDHLKVGDNIEARIKKISGNGKIDLTLKKKKKSLFPEGSEKEFKNRCFEEKMNEFLNKKEETNYNITE